jgi:hypothetical protein
MSDSESIELLVGPKHTVEVASGIEGQSNNRSNEDDDSLSDSVDLLGLDSSVGADAADCIEDTINNNDEKSDCNSSLRETLTRPSNEKRAEYRHIR